MNSNDDIPKDEMLLAEAIAAAKAEQMGWCTEHPFRTRGGFPVANPEDASRVCALGALHLAGRIDMTRRRRPRQEYLEGVVEGNDSPLPWQGATDRGASMGWAFRCAMRKP